MPTIKTIALVIVFGLLLVAATVQGADASLSKQEAIRTAEVFVSENGYTDASSSAIKEELDYESIEWSHNRDELLKSRFNTLSGKAIGVKQGAPGNGSAWSVAFDYVGDHNDVCRVVTMLDDGSGIKIQHQDGIRSYFVGFDVE